MAQMDSSFIANPLLPGVDSSNPLQTAQGIVGLQGQILSNTNAAKTIAANSAMSQIVQQSTNADGTIDYAKLHTLAAQNPAAAYNLQNSSQEAQVMQATGIANQQQQLQLTQSHLEQVGQRLMSQFQDPNATPDTVRASIGQAMKDGLIGEERGMQVLDTIPNDPDQLKPWLLGHARELQNAQEQLQMSTPDFMPLDTGQGIILYQRKPTAPGGQGVQAVVPRNLSPEQLAQQITITDPTTGQPKNTTLGAILQQEGVNQQGQPQNENYNLPGIDQNANHTVQVGPSSQLQAAWTAATQRQQAREQEALGAPNRIAGLDQASTALANLKDTDWAAGPKSQELSHVLGTLNTLGFHIDQNSVTSRQTMVKYLENAINTSAQEAGFNGSNDRLNAWSAGQPDPNKMGPQALKAATAYVRAQTVGQALMSQYVHNQAGNDQAKIAQAEQTWAQHYDANALYLATLPADQRQRVMAKMGPQAAQQTTQHLADMLRVGLINPQDIARYGQADAGE